MTIALRALLLLLPFTACRTATSSAPPPEPRPYVSPLAGFDAPPEDDPVAKEATTLTNGPFADAVAREAGDMQQEGDLVASKLAPGQVYEQEFRLQPGRCYTLVAVGGDGITELDATFETLGPVRGKSDVLARDTATGTTALVGGGGTCFPWPADRPAQSVRYMLRAGTGSGVVVSQIHSRPQT